MQEHNNVALTKKQKDIILGTLLGDGYLNKRGNNIRLQLVHGINQKDYITYKYENIKNICTDRGLKLETFNDKYSPTGKISRYSFYTTRHDYLTYLHDILYINGKKTINKNILSKLTA